MAALLKPEQIDKAKRYVFSQGRLLDRQLFAYFFANGTERACLKALLAYQNDDGGFGNGLEPDLSCPDSSMIGAETALYTLELLDSRDEGIIGDITNWIKTNQRDDGTISHPPKSLFDYPHQPWWEAPDKERILALAGMLNKLGYQNQAFYEKVRSFYRKTSWPEGDIYYSYPFFTYLKYCGKGTEDRAQLARLIERLPTFLDEHKGFFPLFNRLWYQAADFVEDELRAQVAMNLANSMQDDGGFENPYPDLPWWRPIHTVDGLILLRKRNFI